MTTSMQLARMTLVEMRLEAERHEAMGHAFRDMGEPNVAKVCFRRGDAWREAIRVRESERRAA